VVAPLYTYDANKNVTGETTGGVMASYTWSADQDAEDRLIDWDSDPSGGGEERNWDLSLVGDWEQFTKDPDGAGVLPADVQDRNHTDAHEIDDIDGTAAEHDAKGNMTDDAGAGGNSGGGGGNPREFTYDFDNQLVSVEMPDGKVHSFTYDALGRRVSQKVDTGLMGGGPYETTVYVCATHESGLGQVIAEYKSGQPASNPERHYVYGAYVDEPLVFLAPSAQPLAPTYYHRNRKYDILGLTSSTGTVFERYAYTPYGEVTFLNAVGAVQVPHNSPLGNPYLFTGQRYDAAPALHFFKGRYFDAGLGRFLNRDPLGYVDGMSLYAGYVGQRFSLDPTGTSDISGKLLIETESQEIEIAGATHHYFWVDGKAYRRERVEVEQLESWLSHHDTSIEQDKLDRLKELAEQRASVGAETFVYMQSPTADEKLTRVVQARMSNPMRHVPDEVRERMLTTANMLLHIQVLDQDLYDLPDEIEQDMMDGKTFFEAASPKVIVTAGSAVLLQKVGGPVVKKLWRKLRGKKPGLAIDSPAKIGKLVDDRQRLVLDQIWKDEAPIEALPYRLRLKLATAYMTVAKRNVDMPGQRAFNKARAKYLLGEGPNPGPRARPFAEGHGLPVGRKTPESE